MPSSVIAFPIICMHQTVCFTCRAPVWNHYDHGVHSSGDGSDSDKLILEKRLREACALLCPQDLLGQGCDHTFPHDIFEFTKVLTCDTSLLNQQLPTR